MSNISGMNTTNSQMGMNTMLIRFFYSLKCNECMNLWQVIYNEGIGRMFIPVGLDKYTSKQLQNIGLGIKEVPSIVINTQNKPPEIYEGPQKCSQWLTNFTLNRRRCLAQQIENQRKLIQKEHAKIRYMEGGPMEYSECEMDGVSDEYAFNGTDLCQPKNYVMVGDEKNSRIVTLINTNDCKVDKDTLKSYICDIEKSRKMDDQQMLGDMERRQIDAVISRAYGN
jgi:hypothetical protein